MLEAFLDPGWNGDYASGINVHDQVVGSGTKNYGTPAFLQRGWLLDWDADPWKRFIDVAVDPLALVLNGELYARLNLPNPPPVRVLMARIHELVQAIGPAEKRRALARVTAFSVYAKSLEQELSKGDR